MATGQLSSDQRVFWTLDPGKRAVNPDFFSLDVIFLSQAQKDAPFAKGYKGRRYNSPFKLPSELQFKISCPSNETRFIKNMDDFINHGYQVEALTMTMPRGQSEFTITVEYDKKVRVPYQLDIIQGEAEEERCPSVISTPDSDTRNDSGLGLQSPFARLSLSSEESPRTPYRDTVSPPRWTGFGHQSH